MIKVVLLAVIELKQVLKIVEDLADYIALGVTGEIEKFFYVCNLFQRCFTHIKLTSKVHNYNSIQYFNGNSTVYC
jgi:hypothetical protein